MGDFDPQFIEISDPRTGHVEFIYEILPNRCHWHDVSTLRWPQDAGHVP